MVSFGMGTSDSSNRLSLVYPKEITNVLSLLRLPQYMRIPCVLRLVYCVDATFKYKYIAAAVHELRLPQLAGVGKI